MSYGLSPVTHYMCVLIMYGISVIARSTKGLAFEYIKTKFRMCNYTRFCNKILKYKRAYICSKCVCMHTYL